MTFLIIINVLSLFAFIAFMLAMYHITKPDLEEKDIDWVFRRK